MEFISRNDNKRKCEPEQIDDTTAVWRYEGRRSAAAEGWNEAEYFKVNTEHGFYSTSRS